MTPFPLPWPTRPLEVMASSWSWLTLSPLDMLFLAAFVTLLLALLLGRWSLFAPLFTFGYGLQFWALTQANVLTGEPLAASLTLRILRQPVLWRYDSLSWFFALLTIGSAFVCSLFVLALRARPPASGGPIAAPGAGAWHLFQIALALAVLSSLGLFGSGNLLALYIGWELAVWSLFLLLAAGGGTALAGAKRYAAYSFAGGMALLAALALLLHEAGSLDFASIRVILPELGWVRGGLLAILLCAGIGLRLGVLPLLGWKAGATRLPGPLYWHGAAARIGLFAPLVLLAEIIGIDWLRGVNSPGGLTWLDPRTLLCWVAAILLLSAGWQAWRSRSAGAVLSWLALSQTGFILLALLVGGAFGTASGLLLLFSLGLAEAVLAGLCLVAVPLGNVSPTGEANHLNLQRLALGAAVLAAASLIGLPPTLGFVAKWLLYDGLFMEVTLGWNRWLLLLAALLGSLFSVMALLRLTGIMRAAIRERDPGDLPYGVMAPILGLSALTLLAGVLPGPAMGWVAAMQQALGVESLNWSLSGVREHFDMLWISVGQLLLLIPVILWWRARSTDPR